MLLAGLWRKETNLTVAAILLIAVTGWTTPVIMGSGEAALERYADGPVSPVLDESAAYALKNHEDAAHTWGKLFYLAAVLATGLAAGWRWLPRRAVAPLCWSLGALVLACAILGLWFAATGGEIRRPDFR